MKFAFLVVLGLPFALSAQQYGYKEAYPAAKQGQQYMHNFYFPPAPGTTPWWPSWSPDGKSIAFAMQGSIWKVDLASRVATELTHGRTYHSSPDWSPDGRWIVYTADDDGRNIQLEILDVETGATHTLTADSHIYVDPVFSPDGQTLAYVSTKPAGYFNIYTRAIRNGQWAGDEVAVTSDNSFGRDRLYFGPWDFATQPAWTRNGRELLFVSNKGVPLGAGDIWRMPAVRNGMADGKRIYAEQSLYRTRPHVSIDGKRFVYSSSGGSADQYNHLYVLPVDGGQPYKMSFGEFDEFHPRWSPDGESIAYISNEGGLPSLWLLETYGGGRTRVTFKELRHKKPTGRLHLRVIDANGRSTAARIHLFGPDGKFYAPMTAYARRGGTGMHSFHTQGEETFELPAGKVKVAAVKGFEWVPETKELNIPANSTAELAISLKPVAGFDKRGWYSGSTHVHMNYGGNLHNTPQNLVAMARAESMDLVMDQVANKDNRILDYQYFVPGGGEHPVTQGDPGVKLHVGQEYRPPFYGHVFFLGLRDHLISPFTTGYEGTGIESLYPSNTDMFRKARAQGAATGYVHAFSGETDPLEKDLGVARGFAVDAALATFDCMEFHMASRGAMIPLMHAWNNDLHIAPVGGEDSISNLHWTRLVGSVRTYAYTAADYSVKTWLEALKKGHTFMTSGPLLHFLVNGALPGDSVNLGEGGGPVTFEAKATSIAPLSRMVIYRNGKPWKEVPAGGLKESVKITESGWYALYAEGAPFALLDADYPQALTNVVRVYVGNGKIRSRESAEYFVRWIDKLRGMAEAWQGWRSEAEKRHVFAQFDEARAKYQSLAAEAASARQ